VPPRRFVPLRRGPTGAERGRCHFEPGRGRGPDRFRSISPSRRTARFSPGGAGSVIHLWHTRPAAGCMPAETTARWTWPGSPATASSSPRGGRRRDARAGVGHVTGAELCAVPPRAFFDSLAGRPAVVDPGHAAARYNCGRRATASGSNLVGSRGRRGRARRGCARLHVRREARPVGRAEGIYGCGGTVARGRWRREGGPAVRPGRSQLGRGRPIRSGCWPRTTSSVTPQYQKLFVWDLESGTSVAAKGKLGELRIVPETRRPCRPTANGSPWPTTRPRCSACGTWTPARGSRPDGQIEWGADVVWAPDGRRLASSSHGEDLIRIWDATTGKLIGRSSRGRGWGRSRHSRRTGCGSPPPGPTRRPSSGSWTRCARSLRRSDIAQHGNLRNNQRKTGGPPEGGESHVHCNNDCNAPLPPNIHHRFRGSVPRGTPETSSITEQSPNCLKIQHLRSSPV